MDATKHTSTIAHDSSIPNTAAGHVQNIKPAASAAGQMDMGRHTPPATSHGVPALSRCLHRIKKMVPLDERGIWLLNHLLSQTKPEDQEELCWSVQEKLRKRKAALFRSKDRLKLECDRRCVFTKAANEIRTASAMTAEINRCNVLATIVKDHNHATRRSDHKRHHKERRGPKSVATSGTAFSPSTGKDRGEMGSSKSREGPRGRKGPRAPEGSNGRGPRQGKQKWEEKRDPREGILVPLSAPPPPLVLSTKMATAPTSGKIVATSSTAYEAATAAAVGASPKQNRGPENRHGGASHLPSSFENTQSPIVLDSQGQGPSATVAAGVSVNSGKRAGRQQHPRSMGKVRRFGLPPLDERYGKSVVENWVQSPVALRLERPRCKSVDVAHLDQRAFKEYMEGIVRAGAAATQHRGQKRRTREEQSMMGGEEWNSSDMETKPILFQQQRTEMGRSTQFISDPLVEAEDSGGVRRGLPPTLSTALVSPHLGRASSIDENLGIRTSSVVESPLADSNRQDDVDTHDYLIGVRVNGSQAVPASTATPISRAVVSADEALASEALGFRSKGARKVFKQTQRLLEALRTPAESCQVDPRTGARRGCGGGKVGGHSNIVVHHHQNDLRCGPAVAAMGGDKVKRMWRAPRGDRPARLAEAFRCIAAPHTVHIESEIILHESLARRGGGRDGDGGGSGGGSGSGWDDFVFAWECLADGVLAGRALSSHWERAHHDHGGANSAVARSQRAADDLLSDGLMRALLSTRCYRPPGLDQLFVEWLDELLEVVRTYLRRACARVPSQHGLTAGLEWFEEVRV
ncbi:unnamed protein product, partial [Scytosiphon promiscuus]